jgi:hypothetical protein
MATRLAARFCKCSTQIAVVVCSHAEKTAARTGINGHSWAASETVALARMLGEQEFPVLLTIQVDSVAKPGQDDARIPANVAQAVNLSERRLTARPILTGAVVTRAATPVLSTYFRKPA